MGTLGSGVGSGAWCSGFGVRVSEFGTRTHSLGSGPGAVSAADKHSEHSNTDIKPRDLAPVLTPERSSPPPSTLRVAIVYSPFTTETILEVV